MQFEQSRVRTPRFHLSALVDVVFILIIFIVLAANFQRVRAVEVDLPRANGASARVDRTLSITLSAAGLFVGEAEVEDTQLGAVLRSKHDDFEGVIVRADRSQPVERLVRVMDEVRGAGFESLSIQTLSEAK